MDKISEPSGTGFSTFLHHRVGITFHEGGQEQFLRGEVLEVGPHGLVLQTRVNTVLITFTAIVKVKMEGGSL